MNTDDPTKTAGTPDPNDGDVVESSPVAGTSEKDDRNASQGKTLTDDQWKEVLQWKAGAEEAKRLKQQLDATGGPGPSPVAPDPNAPKTFEYFVDKDPVAAELAKVKAALVFKAQLDMIPADEREEVLKHYEDNPGRFGHLGAARAEVRERKLDDENRRLRDQLKALEKGPDPDVVNAPATGGREVTAREAKTKQWTEDQVDNEIARLRQNEGELAALKFQARIGKDVQIKT